MAGETEFTNISPFDPNKPFGWQGELLPLAGGSQGWVIPVPHPDTVAREREVTSTEPMSQAQAAEIDQSYQDGRFIEL